MRGNMLVRWERGLSRKLGFYPLHRRMWATAKPYKSGDLNPPKGVVVMLQLLPGGGAS